MKWVAKGELVAGVEAAGLERPSDHLLARLAREGLLQRPRQRHPGRLRGSVSEYPEYSIDQAIGVLRLHAETRWFSHLRFWTFWEGLWVESRLLRRTLIAFLGPTRIPAGIDAMESIEKLVYEAEGAELARTLRFDDIPDARSAVTAILVAALGDDPGWEFQPILETGITTEDERTLTELAEGVLRLSSLAEPVVNGQSIVNEPPSPNIVLSDVAGTGLGDPREWPRLIRTVPLSELKEARDVARMMSDELPQWIRDQESRSDVTFPYAFLRLFDLPQGRGGEAIRARTQRLISALMVTRLPDQETVATNIAAMSDATQPRRAETRHK